MIVHTTDGAFTVFTVDGIAKVDRDCTVTGLTRHCFGKAVHRTLHLILKSGDTIDWEWAT